MYLLVGILLLLVLFLSLFHHHRKKKICKRICSMSSEEKLERITSLIEPFGYTALYDYYAPRFGMVFDCLPVSIDLFYRNNHLTNICTRHWWATIFDMGNYAQAGELSTDVRITFPNTAMLAAYASALDASHTGQSGTTATLSQDILTGPHLVTRILITLIPEVVSIPAALPVLRLKTEPLPS